MTVAHDTPAMGLRAWARPASALPPAAPPRAGGAIRSARRRLRAAAQRRSVQLAAFLRCRLAVAMHVV
jgi:hypothetical protein